MARFEDYAQKYEFIHLTREDGILELTIHRDGKEAVWTANTGGIHYELGNAFYEIGRDTENRVVILTGAGDNFLTRTELSDVQQINASYWDHIHKEARDLIMNLLEIEVPVIGAVNGPVSVHSELPTLSDIVIASEQAYFSDEAHAPNGIVPGDGVHVWWPMLLGPNRGRHFLMTGRRISAEEGKALGFVAETVPHGQVKARAREVAKDLLSKNPQMLRFSRVALTQHIKRRMLDDLGYGLMLEGMGIFSVMGK